MTVKEIIEVLPDGAPFRIEIDTDRLWEQVFVKGKCDSECAHLKGKCDEDEYNRILQKYGDCKVVRIEAYDGQIYDYSTLWLKVEEPVDDDPYRILEYALFEDSMFEYLETYKHYTILKASINPHNSEYVIQELGFKPRWSSLAYCKKYIKEQLNKNKGDK